MLSSIVSIPTRKVVSKSIVVNSKDKRPIHVPCSNIAYLPSEKKFFVDEPKIVEHEKWYNGKSFGIILSCYLSKHPHLEFVKFHKYKNDAPQVIFHDSNKKINVAVCVNDFRNYDSKVTIKNENVDNRDKSRISCPVPMTNKQNYEKLREITSAKA
jgi:hypothetical protein